MLRRLFARREATPIDDLYSHLALDTDAASADPPTPAFLAPPPDSPPYYGFRVLTDVEVEGFVLGAIHDFESADLTEGDGFVVAPDGVRAGLEWRAGRATYLLSLAPPRSDRFGVFAVGFPHSMRDRADARRNLAELVPLLREKWHEWQALFGARRG